MIWNERVMAEISVRIVERAFAFRNPFECPLTNMSFATSFSCLCLFLLFHGCGATRAVELKHKAAGNTPQTLAVYEAWFGLPKHISVGYSTNNAETVRNQMRKAKSL